MKHINFVNVVLVSFVVLAIWAFSMEASAGGVSQKGTVSGQSDAQSIVVIGGEGAKTYEASDLSDRNPDAIAPSMGSANNCALGVSAAGSMGGIGLSFGTHYESEDCNRREDAAMAARLGDSRTAREVMCDSRRYYEGNRRAREVGDPKRCVKSRKYDREIDAQERREEILDRIAEGQETRVSGFNYGGGDPAFSSLDALSAD